MENDEFNIILVSHARKCCKLNEMMIFVVTTNERLFGSGFDRIFAILDSLLLNRIRVVGLDPYD